VLTAGRLFFAAPTNRKRESSMSGLQSWIIGIIAAVVGVLALFFASASHGSEMYPVALVVFALIVLFEFWLIKRHFDAQESH
jgi:FtsH-binding integral membrane protein